MTLMTYSQIFQDCLDNQIHLIQIDQDQEDSTQVVALEDLSEVDLWEVTLEEADLEVVASFHDDSLIRYRNFNNNY